MTLDMREALDDLAADAARFDLADVAIAGARRRRVRALAGVAVVAVAVLILTLTLPGVFTRGTASPASPPGSAPRYDPTVDVPWPLVRDLPARLDEPLALTYSLNVGAMPMRAVSASGRQWDLENWVGVTPSISADGWHIALYDQQTDELILRDVSSGTSRSFEYGMATGEDHHQQLSMQAPMPWSPDGWRLALSAFSSSDPSTFHVAVLDLDTGRASDLAVRGQVVGWLDNDTLLVVDSVEGAETITLTAANLEGDTRLVSTADWSSFPIGINQVGLSPDGATLAGVKDESSGTVVSIDVATGRVTSAPCACDSTLVPSWVSTNEVPAWASLGADEVRQLVSVDVRTGSTRTLVTFSPRMGEVSGEIAVAASVMAAGPDGHAYTNKTWPGWYLDYITYAATGVLALLVLVSIVIALARRRRVRTSLAGIEAARADVEGEVT